MLEAPDLPEADIVACLQTQYGLIVTDVTFLPLGADVDTAVYRIVAGDGSLYFLKLRRGAFNAPAVQLAHWLSQQGIAAVIPPLPAQNGRIWGSFAPYRTLLYPFVAGKNGYERPLQPVHWRALATALSRIHAVMLPDALRQTLPVETYSDQWRKRVRQFLAKVETGQPADEVAAQVADLLQQKRPLILDMMERTDRLAAVLRNEPLPWVVCHSDLHAGNLLLGDAGDLHIVDWDEPILAPKERDLMYIGGGLLASGLTSAEEAALFYPTYGNTTINQMAVSYYRYERIIQDIAAYYEQLWLSAAGGADRAQSLAYLQSDFYPGHTIDIAYQMDVTGY